MKSQTLTPQQVIHIKAQLLHLHRQPQSDLTKLRIAIYKRMLQSAPSSSLSLTMGNY